MRVMFVDDEQRVLDGIERMLFALSSDWDITTASSGAIALDAMAEQPADVVVSDMRMPTMDGRQLLGVVQARWPGTVRIILSGHAEEELALRSLNVAHQFLAKPCEGSALVAVIERAIALRSLLDSDSLKRLIGKVGHLPPTPRVYCELMRCVADPQTDLRTISAILARDPALSAKVLQVANSAFFNRGKSVASIAAAVTRVGVNTLRALVLVTEVFAGQRDEGAASHLQDRALRAALIAEHIQGGGIDAQPAMTAALLADIGLLIPGVEVHCHSATALGEGHYGHAEVGAYLLGLWGLPMCMVEAVAHHHAPQRAVPITFGVLGAVHVAVALACGAEPDIGYLASVGVADRLPEWRRFAESLQDQAC